MVSITSDGLHRYWEALKNLRLAVVWILIAVYFIDLGLEIAQVFFGLSVFPLSI